jgi:putative peptide zinc metalloprotease protein
MAWWPHGNYPRIQPYEGGTIADALPAAFTGGGLHDGKQRNATAVWPDNQSLAVVTRDGGHVYDVAFALVWANQNTVLNKNEAYAFASCHRCSAEAISFPIVLIVGHAHAVAPENISVAVNHNCVACVACVACVTHALAVQLVLTLLGPPSAAEIADINALWKQIKAFGAHLRGLPFSVIHARLLACRSVGHRRARCRRSVGHQRARSL